MQSNSPPRRARPRTGQIGLAVRWLAKPSATVASREFFGDDAAVDVSCVTVDCTNPATIASFWNDALGWGGVAVSTDNTGAICGPRTGGCYLEFVRVPEAKLTKNRLHLGCSAGHLEDLDAEIERLRGLGATIAWEEGLPPEVAAVYRNVVMRDVEGNEFCLSGGHIVL